MNITPVVLCSCPLCNLKCLDVQKQSAYVWTDLTGMAKKVSCTVNRFSAWNLWCPRIEGEANEVCTNIFPD